MVRFQEQLFSGGCDRVVLQADRVPSFVVPFCQPSSTSVGDRTVSCVILCSHKMEIVINV